MTLVTIKDRRGGLWHNALHTYMVDNYFIDMKTNVNGSNFFVEKTTSVILIIYSLFKLQPLEVNKQRILLQID